MRKIPWILDFQFSRHLQEHDPPRWGSNALDLLKKQVMDWLCTVLPNLYSYLTEQCWQKAHRHKHTGFALSLHRCAHEMYTHRIHVYVHACICYTSLCSIHTQMLYMYNKYTRIVRHTDTKLPWFLKYTGHSYILFPVKQMVKWNYDGSKNTQMLWKSFQIYSCASWSPNKNKGHWHKVQDSKAGSDIRGGIFPLGVFKHWPRLLTDTV